MTQPFRLGAFLVDRLQLDDSKRLLPFGVVTVTSSPSSFESSARPIGDAVEMRPSSTSASSGITSE